MSQKSTTNMQAGKRMTRRDQGRPSSTAKNSGPGPEREVLRHPDTSALSCPLHHKYYPSFAQETSATVLVHRHIRASVEEHGTQYVLDSRRKRSIASSQTAGTCNQDVLESESDRSITEPDTSVVRSHSASREKRSPRYSDYMNPPAPCL